MVYYARKKEDTMEITKDLLVQAYNEHKIEPYEEELIDNLRKQTFNGIPITILLFTNFLCKGECYVCSVNLTRGMDHFHLVHGDINCIKKNDEYPNHSWVEKGSFIYDTTDGFKWEKNLYYELFEPVVQEVYDENTVQTYPFYQSVIENGTKEISLENLALVTQYIEELENENPGFNHYYLKRELKILREKKKIKLFPEKTMAEYRKIMEKEKKTE